VIAIFIYFTKTKNILFRLWRYFTIQNFFYILKKKIFLQNYGDKKNDKIVYDIFHGSVGIKFETLYGNVAVN